jgi:hypothetical protein
VDARTRTKELLDRGDTVDEVVGALRDEGFNMIDSMSALIRAGGVAFPDARAAVIDSPVWADQRERVVTRRWIGPPDCPDADAVVRLQQACSDMPRIAEVWVTGTQMTRHDGSSDVTTSIAVVLDPPLIASQDADEMAATTEIITRLDAAWAPTGRRSWLWVSRANIANHEDHCVAIYARS